MGKTPFLNTFLKGVDFTEADLNNARFVNSDLHEAIFHRTNLKEADLVSATNYSLDPDLNQVKKMKLSAEGAMRLLDKYDLNIK